MKKVWLGLFLASQLMVTPVMITAQTVEISPMIEVKTAENNQVESLSYDLIALNENNENSVIYSYRPENDSELTLPSLEAKKYLLRFYNDNNQFNTDSEVRVVRLSFLGKDEQRDSENNRFNSQIGEFKTLGDGTEVYDIEFEITEEMLTELQMQADLEMIVTLVDESTVEEVEASILAENTTETEAISDGLSESSDEVPESNIENANVTLQFMTPEGVRISGVEIKLDDEAYVSNENGEVILTNTPVGDRWLEVLSVPEGYMMPEEPVSIFNLSVGDEGYLPIEILPNPAEQESFDLTLRVVDVNDNPISEVVIVNNGQSFITNEHGEAIVYGSTAELHTFKIDSAPEGYITGEEKSIDPSKEGTTLNFQLEKEVQELYDMELTINDQNNDPVSGIELLVDGQLQTTNEEGSIIFSSLEPGIKTIEIVSLPLEYSTEQTVSTVELLENGSFSEVFTVYKEDQMESRELTIKIIDQFGNGVPEVLLSYGDNQSVLIDKDTAFTLKDLEPKEYTFTIVDKPDNYVFESNEFKVDLTESSQTQELQANLQMPIEKVTIRVIDQNNKPVKNTNVTLNDGMDVKTTDTEGQVYFELEVGHEYTYTIEIPEGYKGEGHGTFTVQEQQDPLQVLLERDIQPAKVTLNVKDTKENPIEGVSIKFGGLTGTTNAEGLIIFDNAPVGLYHYQINDVPENYEILTEERQVTLSEGDTFTDVFILQSKPADSSEDEVTQSVFFHMINDQGKPVENIKVLMGETVVQTDKDGNAVFNHIKPGDYDYTILEMPENLTAEKVQGQVHVTADKPTTIETLITTIQQDTSSEVSQSSIESEPEEANVHYKDEETGVEIWLHPNDAAKVNKLVVTAINPMDVNLPKQLNKEKAKVYAISMQNSEGQVVNLSHVANVRIPTMPVTTQLRLLRIDQTPPTNITFQVFNERASFKTQQLGRFVIAPQADKQTEVSSQSETSKESVKMEVKKESSVEAKDLPKTGEFNRTVWIIAGFIALVLGGWLIYNKCS